ncbi:histone deacetylase family protein [Methylonatrum kenyense]|uniref:histone deacetylase family protein n=1 Tax=Methylonatrum kenyense TaxID=455253 RepID=UPI0024A68FCB|nr:histone deacetylase family protein [Methylonatrum kenyense]
MLLTHESCLRHDTGPGHPESPERLRAILQRLNTDEFDFLDWHEAPRVERQQLLQVHDARYVDAVLDSIPEDGLSALDSDTWISPHSGEAALRAAGAVCAAVDAVMAGETRRAFCAVRPPGHHAEPDHAMGFCLFNNVAVAAAHARNRYHLDRIAVVDFDVHHGNGTQTMLAGDRHFLYVSSHEHPLFPGTGINLPPGINNILNSPVTANAGPGELRRLYESELLPAIRRFGPQLVLISAGFDAHASDPLANLNLRAEDFGWLTRELVAIANQFANGGVIATLEGGYDVAALAESVAAHLHALAEGA